MDEQQQTAKNEVTGQPEQAPQGQPAAPPQGNQPESQAASAAPAEQTPTARQEEPDTGIENGKIERILDIEVPVTVSFGSVTKSLGEILRLTPGSVIELERMAEEPVILKVNNRGFARGEVVVVDGHYGIKILEVESTENRIASLGG